MPPAIGQPRRERHRIAERDTAAVEQVRTNAAHAATREIVQRVVRHVRADHRDAAKPPGVSRERVDHRAVVRAVDAGLNQHGVGQAQAIHSIDIGLDRHERRRVRPVGCKRKACRVADGMDMAIPCADGHRECNRLRELTRRQASPAHFTIGSLRPCARATSTALS